MTTDPLDMLTPAARARIETAERDLERRILGAQPPTARLVNAITGTRSDPQPVTDNTATFQNVPGRWDGFSVDDGPLIKWADEQPVIASDADTIHVFLARR
jgi:hypothetical protein